MGDKKAFKTVITQYCYIVHLICIIQD